LKPIAVEIRIPCNDALVEKGLSLTAHFHHRKWYLDFCAKYHHEESNRESLSRFIEKLKEKKQAASCDDRQRGSDDYGDFVRSRQPTS